MSMVLDKNNGLIARAKQAANATEASKNNELSDIDKLTGKIDSYQVPVPEGFYYVGGTVETGFVISSVENDDLENTKQGNQFVWIPVANASDFVQDLSYPKNLTSVEDGKLPNGINAQTIAEKGGFYIARYEAGKPAGATNGTTAPVSKKGVTVWTVITQAQCLTSSAAMYSNNQVVSGLITGAGWDVTMKFITNYGEKKNVRDSIKWGNYNNSIEPANVTGAGTLQTKTGFSEYWQANHIYDIAGNAYEYINEYINEKNTSSNYSTNPCVIRGGYYGSGGVYSASYRHYSAGGVSSDATFRVALYIK